MTASRPRRLAQLLGLAALCAIGAELLAAYGDSTGHPVQLAFLVIFFGGLYGAPALLARELVRRCGWGWPSLLLILAALGVAQAGLIDQSLFSADYQGYAGWQQTRAATLIGPLGISGFDAYDFILGHVIFSFGAPLAVAEAWLPQRSRSPWLPTWGIVVAAAVYAGAIVLVQGDPTSHAASAGQLVGSSLVVVGLLVAAILAGRRTGRASHPAPDASGRLPVPAVLGISLGLALLAGLAPESWAGLALGLGLDVLVGVGVWTAARRTNWTIRHVAAVGLGFLLSRGIWAFSYFPLLGHVSAAGKYGHNVVMMLAVLAAGWLALRPPAPARAPAPLESGP